MASWTTLRLLASIALTTSAMGLVACGSTVSGGDGESDGEDGADDDGSVEHCDESELETMGACQFGSYLCVDGSWTCPAALPCPEYEPSSGGSCTEGASCRYEGSPGDCGPDGPRFYDCVDGGWSGPNVERCSPPMPECPTTAPTPSTSCDLDGQTCEYASEMECGPASVTYTCSGGAWSEGTTPRCSMPLCSDLADPESCAQFECRWLEPGCPTDVEPLPTAGCHPVEPCAEGTCSSPDQACQAASVAPDCGDVPCAECAETAQVCVVPPVE